MSYILHACDTKVMGSNPWKASSLYYWRSRHFSHSPEGGAAVFQSILKYTTQTWACLSPENGPKI